ncbi:hypothetical protein BC832DRAFT_595126 [Gaertneriomyces semiglobifer]|nr:hypothetical protein BC832DRAFT_595126 [Gaertneriomyces semiglobifer]
MASKTASHAASEYSSEEPPTSPPEGPITIQLIPFSETPGRPALGEVVERKLKDGQLVRIGRQVVRDGQPSVAKGQKQPTENDIWFTSKVVSRNHSEMWVRDNQVYIKDIGSSSGTFLNKMRLSPSGKESRPYPIKEGDIIQFGIDYKGKPDDVYKCVVVRVGFYDNTWMNRQRRQANPTRFRTALKMLLAAANPYASSTDTGVDSAGPTDCCICIGSIGPFQALFVAPCSHCYHYKCVHQLLHQSAMFQCPMCRQVANLTASVSMDSLFDSDEEPVQNGESEDSVRQMGALRESTATRVTSPGSLGGAGMSTPVQSFDVTPFNRHLRIDEPSQHSPSGDVTPRNDRPQTPASPAPGDAGGTGINTPVRPDTPSNPSTSTTTDAPQRLRSSADSNSSATGSPHIHRPNAQRAPKRRPSLTSKINALLRRGTGRASPSPTNHNPMEDVGMAGSPGVPSTPSRTDSLTPSPQTNLQQVEEIEALHDDGDEQEKSVHEGETGVAEEVV